MCSTNTDRPTMNNTEAPIQKSVKNQCVQHKTLVSCRWFCSWTPPWVRAPSVCLHFSQIEPGYLCGILEFSCYWYFLTSTNRLCTDETASELSHRTCVVWWRNYFGNVLLLSIFTVLYYRAFILCTFHCICTFGLPHMT